ncbi:hypothetical protein HZU77_016430 [Neisseriaceae bacterium TC5R-5]|nr:hypothetical protein [Neisseriaceae bacterium TC5R-5]
MAKPTFNPQAHFRCNSLELALLMFTHDDKATAKELGITLEQWQNWKTGTEPIPKLLWLYLKLKKQLDQMGVWKDYRIDGERLISPFGDALHFDEWGKLQEYRRASRLAGQQAELIETLLKERNFYRQQCHTEAKFGLMLRRLFPDTD